MTQKEIEDYDREDKKHAKIFLRIIFYGLIGIILFSLANSPLVKGMGRIIESIDHNSGPYSIGSFKMEIDQTRGRNDQFYFYVTVKGPANDLAVISTSPDGVANDRIIRREQMITNSSEVAIETWNSPGSAAGKWILTVKTINPEKIVCQKTIDITLVDGKWMWKIYDYVDCSPIK